MSNKITPFFELNGQRYEIKRTRYLLAEYDKIAEESRLSNEDKTNAIKAQSLIAEIQKYGEKTNEFWDKLMENPTKEIRDNYYMFKEMYDKALEELAKLETETGCTSKLQKEGIDLLEKMAIKGLAEQYFNFDESKAKAIWEMWVDTLPNHDTVAEWLTGMSECLFAEEATETEENGFLSQMRMRAEQKANNRKNGIKRK